MKEKAKRPNTPTTVYIGNMSYKKDENGILGLFKKFGYIQHIHIVPGPKGHKSKGIAFVKMSQKDEALKAVKELNGKIVDGRTLKVSVAVSNKAPHKPHYRK
ncbi:MAG: RNA recognition motif domain-containing protein [Bacteriovoracaceae bacterium]